MPSRSEAVKDDKNSTKAQAAEHATAFALGKLTLSELYKIAGEKMMNAAIRAFTLYEQRDFAMAEEAFRTLSVLNPREPYYMTGLGASYLAQDKLDDALRSFSYSISLKDKDGATPINRREVYLQAFIYRGGVYLKKDLFSEAIDDFTRAIELNSPGADAMVQQARELRASAIEKRDSQRGKRNGERAAGKGQKAAAAAKSSKPKKKKK